MKHKIYYSKYVIIIKIMNHTPLRLKSIQSTLCLFFVVSWLSECRTSACDHQKSCYPSPFLVVGKAGKGRSMQPHVMAIEPPNFRWRARDLVTRVSPQGPCCPFIIIIWVEKDRGITHQMRMWSPKIIYHMGWKRQMDHRPNEDVGTKNHLSHGLKKTDGSPIKWDMEQTLL